MQRIEFSSTGERICPNCKKLEGKEKTLKIIFPEDVTFTGKLARMGDKRRIIEIPNSVKPLLDLDSKYIILLRRIK